ncbi:YolD-like family protein [Neobacillus drentensis]|uniref:YolD-like family protein n=1 Tax=Neobacillus drentensis TaxID=220684 RepID=UPI0030020344
MTIRDRGKVKWQFAFGMPELIKAQRELWRDSERIEKPLIDDYQAEEFDQRIAYAMEANYAVKLMVWFDGFFSDFSGRIHHVNPITHQLRIEVKPGEYERVAFEDVVGVTILD